MVVVAMKAGNMGGGDACSTILPPYPCPDPTLRSPLSDGSTMAGVMGLSVNSRVNNWDSLSQIYLRM